MDTSGDVVASLDGEFDRMLVDMKPHVLKLPHKSDRQRCAVWIKKFCEPPASGITGRKNRNMYAKLLCHMLKRGALDGPFNDSPDPGPLPTLPSYMSIYFDGTSDGNKENVVPDWVRGELGSEITGLSSIHTETAPFAAQLSFDDVRDKFDAAVGRSSANNRGPIKNGYRDRSPSPTRSRARSQERVPPILFDDVNGQSIFPTSSEEEFTSMGDEYTRRLRKTSKRNDGGGEPWRNVNYSSTLTSSQGMTTREESAMVPKVDRGSEMRVKMAEARFQEEKLRLQQKHDAKVQQILDRKNTEIEELKVRYRNKCKEFEEGAHKQEKKSQNLQKELTHIKETKERQIDELKKLAQESSETKKNELERKLHEAIAEMEQDKFDQQKQHTKNIQDLLDDTNHRLVKMEEEYTQQMASTTAVIHELEARVHTLTTDAETLTAIKSGLEKDKLELENQIDRLQRDCMEYKEKLQNSEKETQKLKEENERETKALKNKNEVDTEFLKQETNLQSKKAADTISGLEEHISSLKQNIEKLEHDNQKQIRDMEQTFHQDKQHLESVHDKKMRNIQNELDNLEQDSMKKIRKLENALRDKDEEVRKLHKLNDDSSLQSEKALDELKAQVEKNSVQMYEDMKQQMAKVEQDLNRSKQLREKQAKEANKQVEQEKYKHDKQINEIKMSYEQERARLLQELHADKELMHSEKEQEIEMLKETAKREINEIQSRGKEKQDRDTKIISNLEKQVQDLREEVVQSNCLRKQQLVELGLLREEEKQKIQREHEEKSSKMRSALEQQRLELEKKHSVEIDTMLEKTNKKLKDIENEYSSRSHKSNETINELQKALQLLREDIQKVQEKSEQQIHQNSIKAEEEKKKLKQHHSTAIMSIQRELEDTKSKMRQMERRLTLQEEDHDEQLTTLRSQYEDRMKGLIPASVRKELEDTIASLRSQVSTLQKRTVVLQEDLEMYSKYPPNVLSNSLTNSPRGSTASQVSSHRDIC